MPSLDKEHSAVILSPPSDLLQQPIFTNNNCASYRDPGIKFHEFIERHNSGDSGEIGPCLDRPTGSHKSALCLGHRSDARCASPGRSMMGKCLREARCEAARLPGEKNGKMPYVAPPYVFTPDRGANAVCNMI